MKKARLLAALLPLLPLLPGLAWGQALAVAPPVIVQSAPGAADRAQDEPQPAIWLLSDADTRIYVFGTLHAIRPDLRWRSATFDRIAREAQELVLEVSDRELAERGPNPLILMQMTKAVPILERVSPDRREGLARLLRQLQLPEGSLDRLETWGVAALLGMVQMARNLGADDSSTLRPSSGVETVLIREFRASGRPISGAESGAEVIGAFRALAPDAQRAMLDEAVDAFLDNDHDWEPDEAAWARGNLDNFAVATAALPPRLHEMLITRRNRRFTDWLARRLDRPGTVLFAIGAGHLAGPDSVLAMLESRGLHAQRIY